MLMLEDLKRKPELMKNFVLVLVQDKYIPVVSSSVHEKTLQSLSLTKTMAANCKSNFDEADLAFAGASRGIVMKPFFALKYDRGNTSAFVIEYLTFSNDSSSELSASTLENDLSMLAIMISICYPDITEIHFSVNLVEFDNPECSVNRVEENCYVLVIK